MCVIENHLVETETQLTTAYPKRAAIFKEAFEAHRKEMYAASTTLLFTQADGICADTFGSKLLFSTEQGKGDVKQPKTRKVIESYHPDAIHMMLLESLLSGSGMSAGEKDQTMFPDSLNRHTIMHGIDTDYPSRMNSAKVISLELTWKV